MTEANNMIAVEILAKTDPIIKQVWEYYVEQGNTAPIGPTEVKYFWEKIHECSANIIDMKGQPQ